MTRKTVRISEYVAVPQHSEDENCSSEKGGHISADMYGSRGNKLQNIAGRRFQRVTISGELFSIWTCEVDYRLFIQIQIFVTCATCAFII